MSRKGQGRINHCTGCTMGGGPSPPARTPNQLSNFYHTVLTFKSLNVQCRLKRITTTKKGRQLFGEEKEKSWLRVWEKGRRLTLVWGPRMVNPTLAEGVVLDATVLVPQLLQLTDRRRWEASWGWDLCRAVYWPGRRCCWSWSTVTWADWPAHWPSTDRCCSSIPALARAPQELCSTPATPLRAHHTTALIDDQRCIKQTHSTVSQLCKVITRNSFRVFPVPFLSSPPFLPFLLAFPASKWSISVYPAFDWGRC